jgi:glycosyltransferase involved in cell wall biosynthesis
MRLIIPHAYNVSGGVEKVTVSLIKEFIKVTDRVVFVLPGNKIDYFKKIITYPDKLIFESFEWPDNSWQKKVQFILQSLSASARKRGLNRIFPFKYLDSLKQIMRYDLKISHLVKKHKATHCLYMIQNFNPVPKIKIPKATIIYDLYWCDFAQRYNDKFKKRMADNLRDWGANANILFTGSKKTGSDLIKYFPEYKQKVKIIYLAAELNKKRSFHKTDKNNLIFYQPAGIGFQKDHITLFRAALLLARKDLNFRIVLTGDRTNFLADDKHLGYGDEEDARIFYHKNKKILSKYVEILGYCDNKIVEKTYDKCSCVVLPSVFEGFGLPLLEALKRGLPIICSDIPAFKELADRYDSKDLVDFFRTKNSIALAKQMENFIKNPKKHLSGKEIKKRFSHWTWKDVAEAYIKELEKLSR